MSKLLLSVLFLAVQLQADELARVQGSLVSPDGHPLIAVQVSAADQRYQTLSDAQGRFALGGLAAGSYRFEFRLAGYLPLSRTFELKPGLNQLETLQMEPQLETHENILVIGSLREGQARAQNRQQHSDTIENIVAADQIGNFPDNNAAEATQRVPGVNIARDQGEGRYVLVRGTEPDLSHTTVNGEDVPAPEGDLRTVALDVVPLEILDGISVAKAILPNMDGDAIGGTVDLQLRKSPLKQKLGLKLARGYNQLAEDDISSAALLYGNRFAAGQLGVLASFSWDETDRATNSFEVAYDDGLPEEFEQRDYQVNRERLGGHFSLDYTPDPNLRFDFNGSYSQFDDQEFRRRLTHDLGSKRLERELKDRFETQSILTLQTSGERIGDDLSVFKYALSYGYAREAEPLRMDSTFRQSRVNFSPNFGEDIGLDGNNIQPNPTNENLAAYKLDEVAIENNFTNDRNKSLRLSYQRPFLGESYLGNFEVGLKYRQRQKVRDSQVQTFESDDDAFFSDFIDTGYQSEGFLSNRYQMGLFQGRQQVKRLLQLPGETQIDHEADASDYLVRETTQAAYAMATFDLGKDLTLIPGIRYERSETEGTGYLVEFDGDGDWSATNRIEVDKSRKIPLPMFHLKWRTGENSQVRAAITRSYARSKIYDQVPYRLVLREDNEISEGNPDIEFTKSWNLDLQYETFFDEVGLLTLGVFAKRLDDYIYQYRTEIDFEGDSYDLYQALNGPRAELQGLELAFQKNFSRGFGIYLNGTFTDSKATFPDRESTRLPGQAQWTGNLQLTYEYRGLSLRLSGNHHGKHIEIVGDEAAEDVWVANHFQVDFNAGYNLGKHLQLSLALVNLNDEKYALYQGDSNHPIQYEQYKSWGRLGLKYDF